MRYRTLNPDDLTPSHLQFDLDHIPELIVVTLGDDRLELDIYEIIPMLRTLLDLLHPDDN